MYLFVLFRYQSIRRTITNERTDEQAAEMPTDENDLLHPSIPGTLSHTTYMHCIQMSLLS